MNTQLKIDDTHELFSKKDLNYTEFQSDYYQIRYFTLLLIQRSRPKSDERLLLEQQVSEVLKNAVKHGNKCDQTKKIKVWHKFTSTEARLIVEDEGPGFADLEKWNIFNKLRQKYIDKQDYVGLINYVSWRTENSDAYDGGNSLFAALEYWNRGVVYTSRRNTVAVGKIFAVEPMESEGE